MEESPQAIVLPTRKPPTASQKLQSAKERKRQGKGEWSKVTGPRSNRAHGWTWVLPQWAPLPYPYPSKQQKPKKSVSFHNFWVPIFDQSYLQRSESTVNKGTSCATSPHQIRKANRECNWGVLGCQGHQKADGQGGSQHKNLDSTLRSGEERLPQDASDNRSSESEHLLSNCTPQTRNLEICAAFTEGHNPNLGNQVGSPELVPQFGSAPTNGQVDAFPIYGRGLPDSSNALWLEPQQFVVPFVEPTCQGTIASDGNQVGMVCGRHLDFGDLQNRCRAENCHDNQSPHQIGPEAEFGQMSIDRSPGDRLPGSEDQSGEQFDPTPARKGPGLPKGCEEMSQGEKSSTQICSQSGRDALGARQRQPRNAWLPSAVDENGSQNGQFPAIQSPQPLHSLECSTGQISRVTGTSDGMPPQSESTSAPDLQGGNQSKVLAKHRCKRPWLGSLFEFSGQGGKNRKFDVDKKSADPPQHPQRGSGNISCGEVPSASHTPRQSAGDQHRFAVNSVAVEQRVQNSVFDQHNLETVARSTQKGGILCSQTCPRSDKSEGRLVVQKHRP